jgi:FkbM family methyltransferase
MIKKKLVTYSRYFCEYLKHGDFISILASAKYLLNLTSHHNDRVISSSIGTFFCRKKTNDFQFANYKYEWGVKKYLLDNRHSYSVFIDGGACIGDYCVLLSRYNIRCIAFEPARQNFEVLSKNLSLNNLTDHVTAFPYGLGARDETAGFVFNPVNTGASHVATAGEAADSHVEIRTLDSFLANLAIDPQQHIMVKLDIEGMEAEAIKGAENFIRQYPNLTFVIEDKHIGEETIKQALNEHAVFEYGFVDEFNIFAKKINNKPSN